MSECSEPLPDLIRADDTERGLWTRIVLLLASAVFFALGVVGWLVPLVTGIPFYVLSMVTLGMASRRVARRVNRWERRLPRRARLMLRPRRWRAARERCSKDDRAEPEAGDAGRG